MLQKIILRKEIKTILLQHMLDGKISTGDRISLPSIAEELKVSVTPIREALTQLTESGIVTYIANRGFFMRELSEQEALEIYELIAILECEGIKNVQYDDKIIRQLRSINEGLKKAVHPTKKLQKDMEFHKKLIEHYPNQHVHKILEDVRIRIFIYEHEFMSAQPIEESVSLHNEIIDYIESNNIAKAVKILRKNWQISIDQITKIYQTVKS